MSEQQGMPSHRCFFISAVLFMVAVYLAFLTRYQHTENNARLFDLRSKCADLGKQIRQEWGGPDFATVKRTKYESRTNRCYVELFTASAQGSVDPFEGSWVLLDAHTGKSFVSVLWKKGSNAEPDAIFVDGHKKPSFSEASDYIEAIFRPEDAGQ